VGLLESGSSVRKRSRGGLVGGDQVRLFDESGGGGEEEVAVSG
jgi:hypothetical protein